MRTIIRLAVLAAVLALVTPGSVVGADPSPAASFASATVSRFGSGATTGAVSPAGSVLECAQYDWPPYKVNSTTAGLLSYLDCVVQGGVILWTQQDQYIDRCTVEFPPGNCITWSGAYVVSCYQGDGTPRWCPRSGYNNVYNVNGLYKLRVLSTVKVNDQVSAHWTESQATRFP